MKCQYIAGKPTGNDFCKCGKPAAQPVPPYCPAHTKLCIRIIVRKTEGEKMAGVAYRNLHGRTAPRRG